MKKILTLLIIHQNDKVLLGMKKRGFGHGKWNGFGGKVIEGETVEDGAKRELFEESGLIVNAMEKMGVLDFSWKDLPAEANKEDEARAPFLKGARPSTQDLSNLVLEVHIFKAVEFFGFPIETEEMNPKWFLLKDIPYEKMWADDKYWFPLFLEGKKFKGKFIFDSDDNILEHELNESQSN